MSRQLKPQKATTVTDPQTGKEYVVFFDRNDLDFFTELAEGIIVRGVTARECQKNAIARLAEMVSYDWKPVIIIYGPEIDEERRTTHYGYREEQDWLVASVKFQIRRCERSPHPGGEKYKVVDRLMREDLPEDWNAEDSRFGSRRFAEWESGKETLRVWPSPREIVLPYTPELWETLLRLRETILKADAQLETLLRVGRDNKPAFLAMVAGGSLPLLGPAPEEDTIPSRRRKT